jgi:amidase
MTSAKLRCYWGEPIMRGRISHWSGFAGTFVVISIWCGIGSALAQVPPNTAPPVAPYNPVEKSLTELRLDLDAGRVTSQALVQAYIKRIDAMDRRGPQLGAVIAINPRAIDAAKQLDRELRDKKSRGPLHGIPILLKDNIESLDPMPTTAGSLALKQNFTNRDAPIVAQLRAAGAIVLGKTNLSEWANFRSEHSTSGWSAIGGLARNPYVLDRSACGSSSGSAVAIAASFAAASVGTETDGSITCPAAINGIVGLKPTAGLLSQERIVPISHSQDTAGPMGRTVKDVALLLGGMVDAAAVCKQSPAPCKKTDYLAALSPTALRGKRIGVLNFEPGRHPEVQETYHDALQRMRDAGATLIELDAKEDPRIGAAEETVLFTEFKTDLNIYLATTPNTVKARSLADLIQFNDHTPAETVYFGQEIFIKSQQRPALTDKDYLAALALSKQLAGVEGLGKLLADNRLDVLVAPTTSAAWRIDTLNGDHYGGSFTTLPAVSGYPHLSVPMGQLRGLPLGISFIGAPHSDAELLGVGYAFESLTHARQPPKYLRSIDEIENKK